MEEIKHRLGDYKYYFFKNLQNYLDTELLFYGSIKREDYFENASDVDITIINDNVSSILSKLTNYLYIDKSNIKQIYQKFTEKSTILVSGYKLKYDNKEILYLFGMELYKNNLLESAYNEFNRCLNMEDSIIRRSEILTYIGDYYNKIGKEKECLEFYNKAN